jgi:hypothetical protein
MKAAQKEAKPGMYYITPYSRPGVSNMGLEKYGINLHEGTFQEEHITCLELIPGSGVIRYVTGLDEEAPEIRRLPKEERDIACMQIRSNVALIEKAFTGNQIATDDKEFWNKVQLLKPNNSAFWNTVKLTVDNFAKGLDSNDPKDLLLICAIKAGGFTLVHRSKQEAESVSKPQKFFLDEALETATFDIEPVKYRNKAVALLQQMSDKSTAKMSLVATAVRVKRNQVAHYNKNTPKDAIYLDLDEFIHGQTDFERVAYKASKEFIELAEMENTKLNVFVVTLNAMVRKDIFQKEDKQFYLKDDDVSLGRNREEVLAFVENPANGTIAKQLLKLYEERWNR